MALATTETVGFLDQLNQLMRNSKDALKTGGLDVTNWITDTENSKKGCVEKDAEKDALKAASKAKTKESETANLSAYKTGSTRLDAVIGVLGKDTPEGKQASRLRSSLNTKSKPKTDKQNNT
ncbi:MAG: hypothetical protein WA584_21485 [Pyrinomonadaceae bacterium]